MCDQQTQDPVILTQNRKQVFEQWKRNQPVFLFKIFGGVVNNAFKMDLEECRTFEFIKTNDYSLFYRNSNEYNLKFRKLEIKVINKNENPIQEKDDLDKCIIKEDIFTNPLKLDSELIIFCFIKDPWPLQNKFEDFWGDFMAEHIEGLDCKFSEVKIDFANDPTFINGLKQVFEGEPDVEAKVKLISRRMESLKSSYNTNDFSEVARSIDGKIRDLFFNFTAQKYVCLTTNDLKQTMIDRIATLNDDEEFDYDQYVEVRNRLIANLNAHQPNNEDDEEFVFMCEQKMETLKENFKTRTNLYIQLNYLNIWISLHQLSEILNEQRNTIALFVDDQKINLFRSDRVPTEDVFPYFVFKTTRDKVFERKFDEADNFFKDPFAFVNGPIIETILDNKTRSEWKDLNSNKLSRGNDEPAVEIKNADESLFHKGWFIKGINTRSNKNEPVAITYTYNENKTMRNEVFDIESETDCHKKIWYENSPVIEFYKNKIVYLYDNGRTTLLEHNDKPQLYIYTENKDRELIVIKEELKFQVESMVRGSRVKVFPAEEKLRKRLTELGMDNNSKPDFFDEYEIEFDCRLGPIQANEDTFPRYVFGLKYLTETKNPLPISMLTEYKGFTIEFDRVLFKKGDIIVLNSQKIIMNPNPEFMFTDLKHHLYDVDDTTKLKIVVVGYINLGI